MLLLDKATFFKKLVYFSSLILQLASNPKGMLLFIISFSLSQQYTGTRTPFFLLVLSLYHFCILVFSLILSDELFSVLFLFLT